MIEEEWWTNSKELEAFFRWMQENDYDASDLIEMIQNPDLYGDIYKNEFIEEREAEE
jgi:hypothetical protein